METREYLDLRKISVRRAARDAGIPRSTLISILDGGGATALTILKLHAFSGGLITAADLQRKPKKGGGK